MAWVNNNKRNARFNPNRRDDRLLDAEVTARRPPRPQKPTGDSDSEELINTKPDFVLSMESDSRVDWLQMALMQAAEGKLKATALYEVMKHKAFVPSEASHRGKLKAMLTANLHLFHGKQKKALEEAANSWSEGGEDKKKRQKRDSSSTDSDEKSRKYSKEKSTKATDGDKKKEKDKKDSSSSSSERTAKAKEAKGKQKKKKKKSSTSSSSESKRSRSARKKKRS